MNGYSADLCRTVCAGQATAAQQAAYSASDIQAMNDAFTKAHPNITINPELVAYDALQVDDMVVLDLEERIVEGALRPSSDTRKASTDQSFPFSWCQARPR